jgi:heterodisulfide reductase subunit A
VIVAACTPRTHEPLFQETLRDTGLNRALFEMVNIRDQGSWVHSGEPKKATEKAKDLVRMAIAKARLSQPLPEYEIPVIQKALVLGGGIAGMTAALNIADQGFEVFLIEKSDKLGGNARRISAVLSGEDPRKIVEDLEQKMEVHPLVHVYTGSEIESVAGYVGNFTTTFASSGGSQVIEHGVIIVATGGHPYEPKQYCYGESKQVLTQLELEGMLASGKMDQNIQDVVMIQCVGSRGEDLAYCSKICCGQAVKNALRILDKHPDTNVYILYRDIRTYGLMEDYYRKARERGVIFIHYEKETPPVVTDKNGRLLVRFFDEMVDEDITLQPDLLVLSVGVVPNESDKLSKILKVPVTKDRFFLEAHAKLRPVELAVDGVYMCGLAHAPKPMGESIAQAKSAAGKAAIPMAKGSVAVEPIVSHVNPEMCIGCGICVSLCPYQAIQMVKAGKRKKAETIAASCKGCGICASHCPKLAISMGGFTTEQIRSQIKAFGKEED